MTEHLCDEVVGSMALHLLTADGRIDMPYAGKEDAQVIVYLSRGGNGGARIASDSLLFDSYCRRQIADVVTFGFCQAPQKLTGVGREALHIASLSLSIESVEGQ